jgi:hypothetical protein
MLQVLIAFNNISQKYVIFDGISHQPYSKSKESLNYNLVHLSY